MPNKKECEFSVDGMHCDSCELYMEQTIKKQTGVLNVSADSATQKVKVTVAESTNLDDLQKKISDQIEKQGYHIVDSVTKREFRIKETIFSIILALLIFGLFLFLQRLNLTSLFNPKALSYPAIFTLGVLASISTCMAVVGGIAMTLSSKFAVEQRNKATFLFHAARIIGFILLGGIIGLLGKVIIINSTISIILHIVVAVVMISVGADFVGIRLPRLVLPKAISKIFGVFDDKEGWSNAILLGVATFFLPCAFTQSMQLYAITTGSFVTGALVMGTFALGTLPVLSLVSIGAISGVSAMNKSVFGYTMGYLIIIFALLNLASVFGIFGIASPLAL